MFINEKFGLYIRGINEKGIIIDDFLEEEVSVKAITIKLTVNDDLEPDWSIINQRPAQEPFVLSAASRAKFNTFLISDYTDKHFSWSKGNPLYSLLKQEVSEEGEEKNIVLNALRNAKKVIDKNSFDDFKEVIKKISAKASELGIDVSGTTTSIDFKDISIKDNRVCLHDEANIPFRLKGKGLKRLISIAIQTSLAGDSGIVLIDEIEQGLEPDRVQHLVSSLKKSNKGQIFITTHSSNVVVELDASDLFLLRRGAPELLNADSSLQASIRKNPEALFANKLIICEGATEIGICRAINQHRISQNKVSAAYSGVRLVDGTGSNFVEYCKCFKKLGFSVCVFCDSDDSGINSKKDELRAFDISIVDCNTNNSIEKQIFEDLPWVGVKELINYHIEETDAEKVKESIQNQQVGILPQDGGDTDSPEMRESFAKAATLKKHKNKGKEEDKSWFKRVDHGMFIGTSLIKYIDRMNGKKIKEQIESLSNWMD